MPPVVHSFDPPERFVAGTVGEPGERTFFLQARSGSLLTSVALEKQQVQILAERMDELLDQVAAEQGAHGPFGHADPPAEPVEGEPGASTGDDRPLDQPIEAEFRAGTITLSWDPADGRVVVEVFPVAETAAAGASDDLPGEVPGEIPDEGVELGHDVVEPEPDEVFLVRMPFDMARAFARRATTVVAAGRPPCPFCGGPIDPEGHLCPRANGFLRGA